MDDRSDSLIELTKALAKAQAQLKGAHKDAKNPFYNSRYADLASVWDACRDALTSNGLAVVQAPQVTPEGYVLKTTLAHASGEWITSTFPLLIDSGGDDADRGRKGARSTMQAIGSAVTYARRFALAAMVGVCPEDDDGEAAGVHQPAERGQWSNKPARQERQQADGKSYSGPPRTGKALFAWVKDQEQRHEVGLLKYLNNWAKLHEFPGRMVDWDESQVEQAHAEAVRKIQASEPAREREPGEDDDR